MSEDHAVLLSSLGISPAAEGDLVVRSPIDGRTLGRVKSDTAASIEAKIAAADAAFTAWRTVPAPRRGELVRLLGEELRAAKDALGRLVTLEAGKIFEEGRGEVQEMIDICDFAVGLSRQLYGLTIASERPGHRMMETWHPLSAVGVITAFNFPVAVWSWNAAIGARLRRRGGLEAVGEDPAHGPRLPGPLRARRSSASASAPAGLLQVVLGGRETGERIAADRRLRLVSATGSCRMGKALAPVVAARIGRCLLELGGNNGAIVAPSADLDLAVRGITFSAVGTAGQRCTSLRRVIAHEDIKTALVTRLKAAYASVKIGDPLEQGTLVGPLIDGRAFEAMQAALAAARKDGGTVHGGERVLSERYPDAYYVKPAIAEMPAQTAIVREETFAPILYVMPYRGFEDAIRIHNDVPQGLASSVFTNDLREAEAFMSAAGSDCGIVNVNIGPSGAEIGGAFGGEKETGGGRESGSDAWKAYMRRATNTINYSKELPLAQGIRFDVGG